MIVKRKRSRLFQRNRKFQNGGGVVPVVGFAFPRCGVGPVSVGFFVPRVIDTAVLKDQIFVQRVERNVIFRARLGIRINLVKFLGNHILYIVLSLGISCEHGINVWEFGIFGV